MLVTLLDCCARAVGQLPGTAGVPLPPDLMPSGVGAEMNSPGLAVAARSCTGPASANGGVPAVTIKIGREIPLPLWMLEVAEGEAILSGTR